MLLLFGMAGALRSTHATAWADSRAGMMPSSLVRVWKAASASASVTDSYSNRPRSL